MSFSFKMNELYPVISSRVFLLDPPPVLRVLHQPKEVASKMPWGSKKYQNNQQGSLHYQSKQCTGMYEENAASAIQFVLFDSPPIWVI